VSGFPRNSPIGQRFRGFLPVVVDVETGGFVAATDALLEIAAVALVLGEDGRLGRGETWRYHVKPFEGARLDPASLAVNGIDPWHPLRPAIHEKDALGNIFREVRKWVREEGCTRAILVGHNASFDLGFLNAAVARAASSAIPSTRSRASTRPRSPGSPTVRPCCRAPPSRRASTGTRRRRIPPPTTPSEPRTCSARCATSSGRCSTRPRRASPRGRPAGSRPESAAGTRGGTARSRLTRGCRQAAIAPASPSSCLSSPERYISMAMSQPPISSPLTYSCGKVGQFE
jgi:hypothetical protein